MPQRQSPPPASRPQSLHYAPPLPAYRRKRFRRALLLLSAVLLVAVAWRHGPPFWQRARMLYFQRQCLAYLAPERQLISEEPLPVGWDTPLAFHAPDPPGLAGLLPSVQGEAARPVDGPVLFMHERTTPAGRRRLVVVRRTPPSRRTSLDIPLSFGVTLIDPAEWRTDPKARTAGHTDVTDATVGEPPEPGKAAPSLRFFAGRPDPADASHFTIAFEQAGRPGILDGWLRDPQSWASGDDANEPLVELQRREEPE